MLILEVVLGSPNSRPRTCLKMEPFVLLAFFPLFFLLQNWIFTL